MTSAPPPRPRRPLGLVSIGDALVSLAADGPLEEAAVFRRGQLGDALAVAIGAARLGLEAAFVTRVGEDPFTAGLLASWEREGLHLDYVRRAPGRNGLALIGAGADGRQVLPYRDGTAAQGLEPGDVVDVPWDRTDLVFATGATQALGASAREAVATAFGRARQAGVTTVYDPMLRPGTWPGDAAPLFRAAFDEVLPLTDLLILSAPWASGRLLEQPTPEGAAHEARRRGVPQVIVRDGPRGCVVADSQGVLRLDAAEAPEVLRPILASAGFDAGLVAALHRGLPLRRAADVALDAMALAVAGRGDLDDLPFRDQLDARRVGRGREPLP